MNATGSLFQNLHRLFTQLNETSEFSAVNSLGQVVAVVERILNAQTFEVAEHLSVLNSISRHF